MDHTLYDMSDPQSVSIWGPGHTLTTYKISPTSATTPGTPSYSQSLELENRMLDATTIGLVSGTPLLTTVIAGTDNRHAVCSARMPVLPLASGSKPRGRSKNFVDPCDLAPLKKRRIQVDLLSPDERDKVLSKREKNKVAAEKCRVKRREQVQHIRAEYDDYLEANESLEAEIQRLEEEKQLLQELLEKHHCVIKLKA